jgi:hypothetical protein
MRVLPKVFLTGGDGVGWALDEDLALIKQALDGVVQFTGLDECEVVHSMWWESLLKIPPGKFWGNRVICQVPGEPFRYFKIPAHHKAIPLIGKWVACPG